MQVRSLHIVCNKSKTMTVANDTPGKAGKAKADANEPKVDSADKYQNLSESGESTPGLNKFERIKAEKDGLVLKQELDHLAHIGSRKALRLLQSYSQTESLYCRQHLSHFHHQSSSALCLRDKA